MSTPSDMWSFMKQTVIPSLYPSHWYNQQTYSPTKGGAVIIADLVSMLIGSVRLRQIRMKGAFSFVFEFRFLMCYGFAHHRSGVQDLVGTVLSTELPTDYHHNSIIGLSVRWCLWKVGEGFPGWVLPKTLKWVAVYSSVTFHING